MCGRDRGLSRCDRSLVTVSALIAMNRPDQLRSRLALSRSTTAAPPGTTSELPETSSHSRSPLIRVDGSRGPRTISTASARSTWASRWRGSPQPSGRILLLEETVWAVQCRSRGCQHEVSSFDSQDDEHRRRSPEVRPNARAPRSAVKCEASDPCCNAARIHALCAPHLPRSRDRPGRCDRGSQCEEPGTAVSLRTGSGVTHGDGTPTTPCRCDPARRCAAPPWL